MTGNMTDYLEKYGDRTLAEVPLNHVDSLMLCQLSYLKFDGMVSPVQKDGPWVSLRELDVHKQREHLFVDERFEKANRRLFAAAVCGRRFCGMRLNYYVDMVDKETQLQFSAVTFLLEDGTVYIAYRGTDETFVGWKEDFNMAYLTPIPGQSYSVKYLNMVAGKFHKNIYVGGHSKGGNLAVYAAMNCIPRVQERICCIYCMDGPGFRRETLKKCGFEKIEERVIKIIPQSSVVGMLFEMGIHYQVVESNRFGIAQHDPFAWRVEGDDFVRAKGLYESRRFMDSAINTWILSLDETQLQTFVETLYRVVSASKAEDLMEFAADWKQSVRAVLRELRNVDEETSTVIRGVFLSFLEIMGKQLRSEIRSGLPAGAQRLKKSLKKDQEAAVHRPE